MRQHELEEMITLRSKSYLQPTGLIRTRSARTLMAECLIRLAHHLLVTSLMVTTRALTTQPTAAIYVELIKI
ncbi:hypothetical protein DPMN_069787 [Dreissena polymorpha]|uniref:Uncharacterized protein n=1 Tax=Dreissena polymorpha TaxID=45954 RepID=A0A9D4BV77_DREPO|nr:hypothetical protein DPMN_069787 [Dreissena polymorpha]